ncbi:MAG: S8 family serine peptidase [Bacteroidales bacterium]|nr:S8 family serine peptidase [Bacteroidales bacterium]
MYFKKTLFIPLAALVTLAGCTRNAESESPEGNNQRAVIIGVAENALPGQILFKVSPDYASTKASGGVYEEEHLLVPDLGDIKFERLFPSCGRFEKRTREAGLNRWFIADFSKDVPVAKVAEYLSGSENVEAVEYSYALEIADADNYTVFNPSTKAVGIPHNVAFPFNESTRAQEYQWHYNNTGRVFTSSSAAGADADVYAAWQLCTGDPDVIVAVIDQGVKFDHEDLAANMWRNPGEIPDNGIDDDGNGYVDDVYGYNFIDNNGTITFSEENSHGTHVAGTISAVNNNGIGVNGIAGGSGNQDGVRIMTLQTLGTAANGTSGGGLGASARAMKYAADNGAVISQNSWGYSSGVLSNGDWSKGNYSAMKDAIEYFIKYAGIDENGEQTGPMAGGIVIFAAGNDASELVEYPAGDSQVVSVAATSYLGTPSYYTNFGKWVSMCAPGGDEVMDANYGGVYSTVVAKDGSSSYGSMQGTSMACPHVSGACALAVSYYYGADKRKGLTPDMLRGALLGSCNQIDPYCGAAYAGKMGVGSLDTYRLLLAVNKMEDIPSVSISVGETKTIELKDYFLEVNAIAYSCNDNSVAEVSVSRGRLTIVGRKSGNAVISVSDGSAIVKTIEVNVK